MVYRLFFALCLWLAPLAASAEDRLVRLAAPPALVESGLFGHILPRFSLKTQIRVELVAHDAAADMALGDTGRPVFEGAEAIWHMQVRAPDHPGTKRFAGWLTSEIGQRTVAAYAPHGVALFGPPTVAQQQEVARVATAESLFGHQVSLAKCTRCHAVDEATKGGGIGSTPSFAVLRALPDWEGRFAAFYALRPHAAFTIITDVTPPFPDNLPSPIAPIELSPEEVEAVLAYVTVLQAADLGAPIAHQ
jgi:mono/diheme cytochrome c family protein